MHGNPFSSVINHGTKSNVFVHPPFFDVLIKYLATRGFRTASLSRQRRRIGLVIPRFAARRRCEIFGSMLSRRYLGYIDLDPRAANRFPALRAVRLCTFNADPDALYDAVTLPPQYEPATRGTPPYIRTGYLSCIAISRHGLR